MADNIIQVTDSDFKEKVLESQKAVLVDFWAVWCGPCKMIEPELEKIAEDMPNNIIIARLNVDENRNTAIEYSITSIPTLLLFKGGKEVKKLVGAMSKDKILNEIDQYL